MYRQHAAFHAEIASFGTATLSRTVDRGCPADLISDTEAPRRKQPCAL